jgi:tRNA(Ile)-lysidine synthase
MGPTPSVAAVRSAVREALADLQPGDLVLVACSGGADSLALAEGLAFEGPRLGLRAGAVTVDHGLQPGSTERAGRLVDALRALGLDPVAGVAVEVRVAGGPEAAARAARYRGLDAAAQQLGAVALLLGHTRDDQAETVLLGLARGSGARSLAGMPPVRGVYRRPLLGLARSTVRAAVSSATVWEDPHNADPAYARARARHQVLPVLERELGPGIAEALARTAGQLREDAAALDVLAAAAAEDVTTPDGLDVSGLAALLPAVRTRVLRRAALAAGCPAGDLTAGHVAELDRLVTRWRGQGPLHLPGGVRAERRCGTLSLSTDRPPEGRTRP